jgi:lysyl-tRNA synthetase class 2
MARAFQPASELSEPPWWVPDRHQARRPRLIARNALARAVRGWFEAEGFTEVEGAALQVSPGNEAHLRAFATELIAPDGARARLFLHTSPEFACKKLLAAGEERIFDFAKVWRNGERGPLHHPEFTLLEWYRTGEPYERLMDDCAALLALAARTTGVETFSYRDRTMDPFAEPERLTVAQAFDEFARIDLMATVGPDGGGDREALAAAARNAGLRVADDDAWEDIFSKALTACVEPKLGLGRATILCEYPAPEAALARLKPDDARLAERFELYACGVELANAFGELTDARAQRLRFEAEMARMAEVYGEAYPIDEDFLAALGAMPAACGAALGFDRLAMLATGARHVEEVIWTPVQTPP